MAPPGAAPHYFSVGNYANSPLPVISGATIAVGNQVIQRQNATDAVVAVGTLAPQLVVLPMPLPAGLVQSFEAFNQTVLGGSPFPSEGNVFQAFILRPTATAGEYQVIFDSGPLTVPVPMDPLGEITSYPVPNVATQNGDVIAFYGQGIPVDLGTAGMDLLASPAPMAPMLGGLVSLGGVDYPIASSTLTYSFGATVLDLSGANTFVSGGIRKFIDGLPGLGAANANNLGQYIPVAIADTTTYPGSDYYEIAVVQYQEKMHTDLPATLLRGYVQLSTSVVPGRQVPLVGTDGNPILLPNGSQAIGVDRAHYLGPAIVANKDRPVRILFRNLLPTGQGGNLFIPVDTTVMGAGMGPEMGGMAETDPLNPMCGTLPKPSGCYTENRATLHLHGGISPWISDGTPHQWTTPAGESTPYPKGVSVKNVPDMPDPGPGAITFFYTNQQSARLMFYHDHAWGITRLNVYAGEAAAYLITDPMEKSLVDGGILPADQIPLVLQDKTFVPSVEQLAVQDPTWDLTRWGGLGQLWVPHVYVPAQNPGDASGVNQFGRWAYGPWFWPATQVPYGPIANPYYDPNCNPDLMWCEPPEMPGVPYVSMGMEAFNDTPLVNGTAYPVLNVDPKSYRFRILSAANDRFFNLHFYVADATGKEVALNAAEVAAALNDPAGVFPTPDLAISPPGPNWIQVGTEGGFLPAPVVIPPQPITWVTDPTVFNAGNVNLHSLLLGPAERADVVVDFSAFAGKTLILYNDAPAAFPARDPRYDYYTGNADLTSTGGAPTTIPGYGPNTRTVMQVVVAQKTPAPAFNLTALQNAFKAASLGGMGVFESSQHPIVVGQGPYNSAYGKAFFNNGPRAGLAQIFSSDLKFDTLLGAQLTMPMQRKAIHDEMGAAFDKDYGRMSGNLGLEVTSIQAGLAQNMVLYPYVNPASETFAGITLPPGVSVTPIATTSDGTQIWKITHNGVDTHPIHFHLFDVQLINRVGWDGIIRKAELNEIGWKDTVRISPLEDTIVAMRPIIPKLPFGVPDSIRPLNPMMPIGSTAMFNNLDANANPIPPITNELTNFGHEYVWHCHILSHEEMDMMRPMVVAVNKVVPNAPFVGFTVNPDLSVTLTWIDGTPVNYATLANWGDPSNEVGYRIERGVADAGGNVASWTQIGTALANVTTFTDNTGTPGTNYKYRVNAWNAAGQSVATTGTASIPVVPPATGVTLAASDPSPHVVGTPVLFTAAGQGSTGYLYRFRLSADGGLTYTLRQDWSPIANWTLPGSTLEGRYRIQVEVKTNAFALTRDAQAFMDYVIAALPPATGITLTASVPSPVMVGTDVLFTAAGQGSTGYQYRFRTSTNGGLTYTLSQDWSPVATWTLPGTTPEGSYRILAEVRTSSFSVTPNAIAFKDYLVTAILPATGVILTASAPSPVVVGTDVIFTAAGQGSSGYQYRFRTSTNGGLIYTLRQDWSATATWTLPGTTPEGAYRVLVEVRTNSLAVKPDAIAFKDYVVSLLPPATGITLTSDLPSPQVFGTPVLFTAAASGSSGYQYRFRTSTNGGATYTLRQDWSAVATWTLPGTTAAGTTRVLAEVRTSPFSSKPDVIAFKDFKINP